MTVLRAMRPRQWLKNLLVLAAPIMSGRMAEPAVLTSALIAFVAFCLAASAIYLLNDVRDVDADRLHPRKRHRPVASGALSARAALILAAGTGSAALLVATLAGSGLVMVIVAYLVSSLAYVFWLKSEPVLDIALITTGFLLRAVAGGVAADIVLSQWFLLAAAFGSLFMAAGKRYADVLILEPGSAPVSGRAPYTPTYLRFIWTVAAGVLITTYGLWAFEVGAAQRQLPAVLSIAPFVLAVLRYAHAIDAGIAGEPEEIAWRDRVLQALALIWLALVTVAVY